MESARISALLDRYFEGETSLLEEQELRNYFTSGDVAPAFEEYEMLFTAFAKAKEETSPQTIKLPSLEKSRKKSLRWMTGVAAAAVIALGLYVNYGQQETFSTSYESEEVAILKTQQALGVMSQMLSQSTTQLEVVNEFEKASSTLFK